MITFKQFLMEARKNPIQNPKSPTTLQQLQDIVHEFGETDTYVRFVTIPKLGLNPQTIYDTPTGLHAYPIKYVIDNKLNVPFAGDSRYLVVFKPKVGTKIWRLGHDNIIESKHIIIKAIEEVLNIPPSNISIVNDKQLWYYMYNCIKQVIGNNRQNTGRTAAKILRRAGIDGIDDPNLGIIHPNEPTQALFLNTTKLQLITIIDTFDKLVGIRMPPFTLKNASRLLDWYYNVADYWYNEKDWDDEEPEEIGDLLHVFRNVASGPLLYSVVAKMGNIVMDPNHRKTEWSDITALIYASGAQKLIPYGFDINKYQSLLDRRNAR
jgi:hypothetical protein